MSKNQRTEAGAEQDVARTVLPGGLRVITESLPAVRSAAFGIWAGVGSRDRGDRGDRGGDRHRDRDRDRDRGSDRDRDRGEHFRTRERHRGPRNS